MGAYWSVSFQRSQGRVAAQAINASAVPGDVVVMCPDQLGPAFSRSLRDDLDTVTYPTMASPEVVDWVDYGERNAASDPAAFVEQVLTRAGSHTVYLVWQTSYKTFEGKCEGVFDALGAARPGSTTLLEDGGSTYFEPAAVTVFPAPPPASP
jgi:mannosyltransferase